MKMKYLLAASVVSLTAGAALVATPAAAQQITSGVQGFVTDEAGTALSGAQVVVTDTRTGTSRTLTAGDDGSFRVDSLVTGGPYTVTATASGYEGQSVEDVFINLQGNAQLTFSLSSAATADAENVIVVTGARVQLSQRAIGPGQSFGEETLEAFPSISRDIRDIIRIDPRVSLAQLPANNQRISVVVFHEQNIYGSGRLGHRVGFLYAEVNRRTHPYSREGCGNKD